MSSLPSMVKSLTPKTSNMEKTTESIAAATKVGKEILCVYGYNDPDKYPDYYGALEIIVDLLHLHQGDITKIPDQLRTY